MPDRPSTSAPEPMQPRPLRADAVRNRRLLLDAAAGAFAEHGVEASIAQIAARAGVGKGTVFRHFATKEQLVAAILADHLDTFAASSTALLDADDPTAALLEFMTSGVERMSADRSFCQVTTEMVRGEPQVRAASERLARVAEALTDRARRQGAVRDDVTGHDVVVLISAAYQVTAPMQSVDPGLWRRYLALIFDGLRSEAAHPLPHPAPGRDQFSAATETDR
ncbi:TetR/AcrR family transcriptional regulator [Streptomyces sp. AcH 505]|uniref:TetR/AcrR family transcriptional regulator n=1 Tax=Streptomyces sp. AcH 505 TaxID=352211 RepID=UPI001F52A116